MTEPAGTGWRAVALAAWRRRRLDLAGLPPRTRTAVVAGLAALAAVALTLLLTAADRTAPGGRDVLPFFGFVPRVATVVMLAAASVGAALVVSALAHPHGWLARLGVVVAGVLAAALGAELLLAREDVREAAVVAPALGSALVVGWAALVVGCLVTVLPARVVRRAPAVAVVAGAPFAAALWLYFTGGTADIPIRDDFIAAGRTDWPSTMTGRAVVALALSEAMVAAVLLLDALAIAQVVEAARAIGDATVPLVRRARRWGWWVVAILGGAQLAWAAVALAAGDDHWSAAFSDGWLSWVLAAAVAGVLVWWLAAGRPTAVSAPAARRAGGLIVAGLLAGPVLLSVYSVALSILDAAGPAGLGGTLADGANAAVQVRRWAPVVAMLAAVGLAAGWLATGRSRATALAVLVIGAWTLPRALVILADLVRYPDTMWAVVVGGLPDYVERGHEVAGWTDSITVTLTVAVALTALAAARLRARQHEGAGPALAALLGVGAVAHAGVLVPNVNAAFYVALVAPLAYLFLADAEALNEPGERRPERVTSTVALAVLALAVTLVLVVNGRTGPGGVTYADFGAVTVLLPLAVLLAVSQSVAIDEPPVVGAPAGGAPAVVERGVSPRPG